MFVLRFGVRRVLSCSLHDYVVISCTETQLSATHCKKVFDELIQVNQITPQLALKVLLQFDKAINNALATRVKNKVMFKGHLNTYRFCDNVWTFVLNNVEFKEVQEMVTVGKVKIVACEGAKMGKP